MKVGSLLLVCSIALLIAGCASVRYEEHTDAGSKYVLANGLTLLVKENPDTGMVAIDFMVKKGLASEGTLHGISHFTNRMLLAGTRTRNRERIVQEVEQAGGSIKARTYAEYSEIIIEIPSDRVSVALDVLQDVVLNPVFDLEEVERERTLILGELVSKKDQPNVVAEELFMEVMYDGHPYRNPIDGYEDTVGSMTRDDLLAHYKEWYAPNNLIIAIAGNVREKAVVRAIDSLFGKMAGQGPLEVIPLPSFHERPRRETQHMPLESFYIQQGYQLVPAAHPDFIKLRLANAVLGAGSGSRLFYELRDKRALAYTVYSIAPSIRTTGFLKISMISRPEVLNESIEGINEQAKRLQVEEVPEEELVVVKQKIRGFFALDHQRTADQANYLGLYELQGLGYHYDVEYPDRIAAVGSAEVKEVANKYLHTPVTAIVGPFEEAKIE